MTEFQKACAERDIKVDHAAARMVRNGVAPYEALRRAAQQVQEDAKRADLLDLVTTLVARAKAV